MILFIFRCMYVRIVDIQPRNLRCITCTWKTTTLTVRPFTNSMTRGISSSQMQILPACYFKLIPNNSDLGHQKNNLNKKTRNIFPLALIQVQLKNLLYTQCLKITQNVSFGIFHQLKLTSLVTLFTNKLQVFKYSPNWLILAFLMNFRMILFCNF